MTFTDLSYVLLTKYAGGYVCTGYDAAGGSLMDSEQKPTPQEAINNLLWLLHLYSSGRRKEGGPDDESPTA